MNGVDLTPRHHRLGRTRRAAGRAWLVGTAAWCGVVLCVCAAVHGWRGGEAAVPARDLASINVLLGPLEQQQQRARRIVNELEREQMGRAALADRIEWTPLLRRLAADAHADMVLRAIELRAGDLRRSGGTAGATDGPDANDRPAPRVVEVQVEALATSIASATDYVLRLERAGAFDGVVLEESRPGAINGHAAVAFTVRCWIEARPVADPALGRMADATPAPALDGETGP